MMHSAFAFLTLGAASAHITHGGGGYNESSAAVVSAATAPPPLSTCPIRSDTTVVYSIASGVGAASQVWVEDLLWWWASSDPSLKYQSLAASETQACALAKFPSLRVFVNPGGDAYNQLSALGATGRQNVLDFVARGDTAYVGFCAGGCVWS